MADRIVMSSKYRRAALNIEEKLDRLNFSETYIPTPQSESFIGEIVSALQHGGSAHALSGAYGVGKSSLAIFLLHQLCSKTKSFQPTPFRLRNKTIDSQCAKVRKNGGLLSICAVGAATSIASRIISGAQQTLSDYVGTPPAALKKIATMNTDTGNHQQLLSLIKSLVDELKKHKKFGVMLILDEFGRHLERMVALHDPSDMYLLQGLAEMAGTCKTAFSLLIIQHYGMEHYTHQFLKSERLEWEKTSGRLIETWLSNSEQDVADIAASLFRCRDNETEQKRKKDIGRICQDKLFQSSGNKFADAVIDCYPLHPATIMALTHLSAHLGQNDRTVTGWIVSEQDSGFEHAANKAVDWVFPSALYHHFFSRSDTLPLNPVWARRVSEIYAADERFEGDENAFTLFQTIAVLNCVKGSAANRKTLELCLPRKFPIEEALSILLQKSLVIYRRHRGEYCVWQGSDYDIADAVLNAVSNMENFSLANELNTQRIFSEIIASRHLIKTGNLYNIPVKFIDEGAKAPNNDDKKPRVLIYLGEKLSKAGDVFFDASNADVCGYLPSLELMAQVKEIAAMRLLISSDPMLQAEFAAKRELEYQIEIMGQRISDMVGDKIFSGITWHFGGKKYVNVQEAIADSLKKIYSKGFNLHNELINRDHASGAMTAALRALCAAMIESPEKENLGFSGYPPQLLIYKGLLYDKKLHVKEKENYHFLFNADKSHGDMKWAMKEIEGMLFSNNVESVSVNVEDIINRLMSPPYGVKKYPAMILCIVCLLYHKDVLALYEDNRYTYNWGKSAIERLISDPARFSLSSVPSEYVRKELLSAYYFAVTGRKSEVTTIISVAKELLTRYAKLDYYTKHSDSVSEEIKSFRRAIIDAKSPVDMLFNDIPLALGYKKNASNKPFSKRYFTRLGNVLDELEKMVNELFDRFSDIIVQHYGCNKLSEAKKLAAAEARVVLSEGRMYPLHNDFLAALQEKSDDSQWLEGVLISGMDSRKFPKDWSDTDDAHAEFSLRRNLLWLREAFVSLKALGKEHFFIGINRGNIESLKGELEESLENIIMQMEKFPADKLQSAMFYLNHRLHNIGKK